MLLGAASHVTAQPSGTLRGVITDSTSTAVADVVVTIVDAAGRSQQSRTSAEGHFVFENLVAGTARLTTASIGWQPVDRQVMVPASDDLIRIALAPAGLEETVVVIGTSTATRSLHPETSDVIGSVDVIGGDQIERENVDLSYELLKRVPGVYVSDYNQGVVAGGVAMRGFNTEGDIMHTKLLIDGIPSNTNSGVGMLDAIFPFDIDRIELVKGTNDPRYGLLNIAGNVQVFTSAPGRYNKVKLLSGAYGTVDTQGVTAFSTGRLSHVYFGGFRRSAGYRNNSDLDRMAVSGKWSYAPASGQWRVGAIARVYDFDTQAPGYLTALEVDADPRQSPAFSATDGGRQRTQHISLHVDRSWTSALSFSAKAYRQTFEQQRWVRFTAAGLQQERFEDESQSGALVIMTWRPSALASRETTFSWGGDVQFQDNLAKRYRTAERVRGVVLRDHAFDFSNGGAYAMVDSRLSRWLRVTGGLRGDRVGGSFADVLTATNLPIVDYGTIWQPKGGVIAMIREGFNIYGNVGRSFQVGVGAGAYSRLPLDHSKNDGWEAGVRTAPVSWLAIRLGVWGQDASDELRLKFDNSGDSENVGRTRRRGWNIEATARPHPTTYLWATFTRQKATIEEPGATQPELRGHELNHTPRVTAKAGVDVTPSARVSLSAWLEAQGDYYLTTANTLDRYGDRRLVNLDALFKVHRAVTIGAHLKNVFDAFHEYVWFDGVEVLHSPGERRALYVTSTFEF